MPRSIYHQSPGNPIQLDKLPSIPMELEFAYGAVEEGPDARAHLDAITQALGASIVGCVLAWLIVVCPPLHWLGLGCFVLLPLILINTPSARDRKQSAWLLPLVSMSVAGALATLPVEVTLIGSLAGIVYLAREFARHYAFLATVTPTPTSVAWETRKSVAWQTLGTSAALLPVGLGFVDADLLPLAIVTSIVAFAAIYLLQGGLAPDSLSNYRAAITSWCSYNRYDVAVPGILQSPSGDLSRRLFSLQAVLVSSTTVVSLLMLFVLGSEQTNAPSHYIARLLTYLLAAIMATVVSGLLSLTVVSLATFLIGLPAYSRLALPATSEIQAHEWKQIAATLRGSHNEIERESLYLGRLASDQSPLLVPRKVFGHHAHFLGDSGSGKTSRGLAPLLEQLVGRGDCSCMVLDLKGDSQELLQTALAASRTAQESGGTVPVKAWSLNDEHATHAFNPLQLDCWKNLSLLDKTDALCGALGLNYGSEYGAGYYSSANAAVVFATLKHFPNVDSFNTLAEKIRYVISRPKAHGLDEKARDAGNHVRMIATRLAAVASLNVTRESTPSTAVLENSIDPARLFQHPEVHYFCLPSAMSPGTAPEIGRLAAFLLLAAATVTKRSTPVYLIIDEFQRLAARNLDYLLQLGRSMNVAVILANQSIEDLRRYELVSVVETNCRYRQWFSISGWEDQQRLCKNSGETVDELFGHSVGTSSNDKGTSTSVSDSSQQFIGPRLTLNDIKLVSDDDRKSVVLINRGDGYAQYGGMPIVVETDYHISASEYEERRDADWPSDLAGSFIPNQWEPAETSSKAPSGRTAGPPISFQEFSEEATEDAPSQPTPKPKKRRQRKNRKRAAKTLAPQPSGPFQEYLRDNPIAPKEDGRSQSEAEQQ